MSSGAPPRFRRLEVPFSELTQPGEPDPLGPSRRVWADAPVRMQLIRHRAGGRSVAWVAVGAGGVVAAGAASGPSDVIPVGIHPDPGSVGRIVAEIMGVRRPGPPPSVPFGPLPVVEAKTLLSGSPYLVTHWVRMWDGKVWRDGIGAVTAAGCGWSVVDALGDGRLVVRPSDAGLVWVRLCRLTALVARLVAESETAPPV